MIIAADFDRTITLDDAWPGVGRPNWPMITLLIEAHDLGHSIILWTCRNDEPLQNALAAARAWGLTFAAVNANLQQRIDLYHSDTRKISADLYIDDKALLPLYDTDGSRGWPKHILLRLHKVITRGTDKATP